MNNKPVAWMDYLEHSDVYDLNVSGRGIPLYTHPAKNNGGNPEELNTRQIQDARTSLESTPPFAYAVYVGEDDRQNIFLQFDHPEMCFQKYKKAIPLYTHPAKTLTEIIEKNKPEIEKVNAYIKLLEEEIEALKTKEQKDYEIISDLLERNVALKSKTLTDEEIDAIGDEVSNLIDTYAGRREFARAILRKAQENGY